MCRILFSASSSGNTTMRCHNNWSLNYTSKVSARGRLIHHSREARRFELAAVSAAALKAREACLKLRCKAGLAAKLSVTPRSVTRVHVQGLFELYCWQANQAINKQCPILELRSWNICVKPHPEDINCRCGPTKNTSCTSRLFPQTRSWRSSMARNSDITRARWQHSVGIFWRHTDYLDLWRVPSGSGSRCIRLLSSPEAGSVVTWLTSTIKMHLWQQKQVFHRKRWPCVKCCCV